ncbi:PspC domain-containing protein [Kordia sp. YSTF-M3]|uniref:PspC domain-containing protein n=1 Tax=Kordia aestuariivivens TaxID=2759037 RepID=A0ABR7Q5F1_9FLAO|nr:PspC domain-containing protein [Kordia aestuariivivens]MBC8753791.1 PspC domain-containing protein [Kordia aestuariivivens]
MNKTININLANMFFHIDEEAYNNLQRYLNAIKRSFTDSQGRDEIIADIEARVAELFSERMKNERQVISMKEVEEVINIMGQPEDYLVDDEIFEDEPKRNYSRQTGSQRKLYRDFDNKFIAGVCAGFAQYFGIDALWIRLFAIIVVLAGVGSPILVYIILWVIIPKANTTTEKLAMAGKPANITNIEKKIKEGLDDVQEKLNDVNFDQVGERAKSGASSFFDSLGEVAMVLLKIFAKFFGVIFIIVAASLLISVLVSTIGVSFFNMDVFSGEESLYYHDLGILNETPRWVLGLLILLALGIPALVLFILGIRILVKNSKSIGMPAKIALFVLWIGACIAIAFIASSAAIHHNIEASVSSKFELPIVANDTIKVKMVTNEDFNSSRGYYHNRYTDYEVEYDENGDVILFSSSVRLIVKPTESENARLRINKSAGGVSYTKARERAQNINYNYLFEDNTLKLDNYFLFDPIDKHNQQEIEIELYLPEGAIIFADKNTKSYHRNSKRYGNILGNGEEENYYQVIDEDLQCLDCNTTSFKKLKKKKDTSSITINSEKVDINIKNKDVNVKRDTIPVTTTTNNE